MRHEVPVYCICLLALLLCCSSGEAQETREGPRYRVLVGAISPSESIAPELQILEGARPDTAVDLQAQARCSAIKPGVVVVSLSWRVGDEVRGQQRLDLTSYWDGFKRSLYQSFWSPSPVVADQAEQQRRVDEATAEEPDSRRDAIELETDFGGFIQYWRVLTLTDAGWAASEIAEVELPVCPVDRRQERPPGR